MGEDSDSSTESSIQNHKKAARLNRRLKKYKSNKRWFQHLLFLNNLHLEILDRENSNNNSIQITDHTINKNFTSTLLENVDPSPL